MSISIENTSTLGRRLTVSLANDKLAKEVEARFTKLYQTAQLKGFRKGKVPPKLLKEKFSGSIRMEAIEELVKNSLHNIIQDKKLNIAGRPAIEKITDLPEKDLEYVASFEIYPEIQLADLSTVDFEKVVVDINEPDVESMIEKLKDRFCDWKEVDRKTELTDKLTMDFSHQFESEKKAGIQPEIKKNATIVLGAEGIVPGLSEALVAKQKEETITTELLYPQAWDDERYAGKKVYITATIHKIEAKQPLSQEGLIEKLMIEDAEYVLVDGMDPLFPLNPKHKGAFIKGLLLGERSYSPATSEEYASALEELKNNPNYRKINQSYDVYLYKRKQR